MKKTDKELQEMFTDFLQSIYKQGYSDCFDQYKMLKKLGGFRKHLPHMEDEDKQKEVEK